MLFMSNIAEGTREELKDALQNLIFTIFNQKRIGTADKYESLVYSFLVLYSFCRDGNLNRCNMFTQYFSRVIWFGRVSIFNIITEDAEVDCAGFFEQVFRSNRYVLLIFSYSIYPKYKSLLMLQSDYPLSSLYDTKNLAKKIAEDQELDLKVSLSEDRRTAVLGTICLSLSSFGVMYDSLLAEIETKQRELFGGISFEDAEWFGFRVPKIISDDNNRSQPGYWFADHESNQEFQRYEDLGLKVLFEHPRLEGRYGCVRSSDKKLVMNAVACQDFLERSEETKTKCASALHISLGGPPRGSEIAPYRIRNHPGGDIRNARFIYSNLCFAAGYNKSSQSVSALF